MIHRSVVPIGINTPHVTAFIITYFEIHFVAKNLKMNKNITDPNQPVPTSIQFSELIDSWNWNLKPKL